MAGLNLTTVLIKFASEIVSHKENKCEKNKLLI